MNPIFAMEWRSRWRDKRSFWLLFALCTLMSILVGVVYNSSLETFDYYAAIATYRERSQGASAAGKNLFSTLAFANGLAWLFIAPVLAATPIARERERGLLESLQLSQMHPRGQVLARFSSHLLFLLLLQVICLPVYGIAIALGGIGPAEILGAMLCILLNAIFGIGIGMWVSARSYRPMGALFTTLTLVLTWSVVTAVYADGAFGLRPYSFWSNLPLFLHPQGLLVGLLQPYTFNLGYTGAKPFYEYVSITCAFHGILLAFFLLDSARMSAKNFPPPAWKARNTTVARWKAKNEARRIERERQRLERDAKEKVVGALVADVPLEKLVHFKNPILSREVKARFRLRRSGFFVTLLRGAAFICGAGLWLYTGYCLLDPLLDDSVSTMLLLGLWLGGSAYIALAASSSFVREIESGTWEGLHLSLLTTREILFAKLTSSPVAFLYYTLPLWLLVPFLIKVIFPVSIVLALCVIFCSFAVASAVGLYCSRRNRTSVAAACWTFGLLFCLWGAIPWLADSVGVGRFVYDLQRGALMDADGELGSSNYSYQSYYSSYYSGSYDLINFSPPVLLSNLTINKKQFDSYDPYNSYESESIIDQMERNQSMAMMSCFISILLVLFLMRELSFELNERGKKTLLGVSLGRLSRGPRTP